MNRFDVFLCLIRLHDCPKLDYYRIDAFETRVTCIGSQVKKSLEWLQEERVENHRFAAVLILKVRNDFCYLILFFRF